MMTGGVRGGALVGVVAFVEVGGVDAAEIDHVNDHVERL